ncbi:MAG: GH1 family beta-glucosidase [Prevotella sp.]|nr:GH1 family beta-glucosidase [Prevotella sp.]
MSFKKDFIWGTATASYQVEGAAFEDGKGLNIWDAFSHIDGKVFDNHNGDTACDCYHRLDGDLDLMKSLGVNSYRFSVSWSRIIPDGAGEVNPKGLDFYSRLIDGLISRGIKPCMTLYHWDLPYALHLKGGWLNDDMPDIFAAYAKLIKEQFGGRVHDFITFNEPQVFVGCGYLEGKHAPGYRLAKPELMRIGHNVLKAHGKAVLELRKGEPCRIGISSASQPAIPVSAEDTAAARENYFQSDHPAFPFSDAYWLDPMINGRYPDWVYECKEPNAPVITDEDLKLISQPIDFIGMNIYNGRYIHGGEVRKFKTGMTRTSIGWPVTPEALYWGPYFYYERYKKPIVITENGMACHDRVSSDGKVHDPNRIEYLREYLQNFRKAAEDGVDADGYYIWSFMDNFEWSDGYKERFGIVYNDYETQQRTVKDSALWYKDVISSNGENLR